jgi:hypothetical protein
VLHVFDPARWPESAKLPALGLLIVLTGLVWIAGTPTSIGPALTVWLAVAPGVAGAMLWRFDRVPLIDILTWTVPMTIWIAGALLLIRAPVRWFVAFTPAGLWLAAFAFWTPVVGWWYRSVLRRRPHRQD